MARRLIAAAEPRRHLPWEGFTDAYRDLMRPRGIPEAGFLKIWASGLKKAVRQRYSIIERQIEHPLRDSWWQSLVPDVERINIPDLGLWQLL